MPENNKKEQHQSSSINRKKTLFFSLIILVAGVAVTAIIFFTEPKAKRQGATKETAMLVNIIEANKGSYRPQIITTGTVVPAKDVNLSPRVSGEIINRSNHFTPGGFVKKGEMLVQIDPSDYKNTLQLRKSELQQAEADFQIEMGRQNVARKDYELLESELAGEDKSLVLREPQLNTAQSRVEAAKTVVEQAELELQRTSVRAPFDAHILSRNVNIGSQVAPGENLGRMVGTDVYWVEITVPLSKLRWLRFPESAEEKGSEVQVRNRTAWKNGEYRTGNLYKLIGALENQTRLARALVAIEDPLARTSKSEGQQPLIIGAFMETNIQGEEIKDVFRIDRDYLRKDETVWIMTDEKLEIREVEIIFTDAEYAYITSGIEENDKIVTTNITTVVEGAKLRVESGDKSLQTDTVNTDQDDKKTAE